MIEIKDLLFNIENIILKGELNKIQIKEVLYKNIKINIDTSDIEIKNGSLFLNIKPIYKNEILLKESKIKKDLFEVMGKKSPLFIR